MRRRAYLATAAATLSLAGCSSRSDDSTDSSKATEETDTATATPSPTPHLTREPRDTPSPDTPQQMTPTTVQSGPFEGYRVIAASSENRLYVEVPAIEFTDKQVQEIKSQASRIEDYRGLLRNASERAAEPVRGTGTVGQTLTNSTHYTLYLSLDQYGQQAVYASWTGDRYVRGDQVGFWGIIVGVELYQPNQNTSRTVPALALADIALRN